MWSLPLGIFNTKQECYWTRQVRLQGGNIDNTHRKPIFTGVPLHCDLCFNKTRDQNILILNPRTPCHSHSLIGMISSFDCIRHSCLLFSSCLIHPAPRRLLLSPQALLFYYFNEGSQTHSPATSCWSYLPRYTLRDFRRW